LPGHSHRRTGSEAILPILDVTETVFNLPGVARYLVDAIQGRDYPIVQNLAMLIAVVVVFANLTVDLLYTWLDPRIKYGRA